jgi:adenylate cyclase
MANLSTADAHTFLFMDLVGFSALTAERGDDRAAEVALALYARVRSLLPLHRGEEIKTIGDAMMVRCADPREGVELGLRISEEIAGEDELPPLRIGVHTGSAVYRDGDWYGSAVNVAARLCSAAAGGEVLISESAREAAGSPGHIEFGERRLHWLKNIPEPVAAVAAVRRECAEVPTRWPISDRSLRALALLKARRGFGTARLRHSEVTG